MTKLPRRKHTGIQGEGGFSCHQRHYTGGVTSRRVAHVASGSLRWRWLHPKWAQPKTVRRRTQNWFTRQVIDTLVPSFRSLGADALAIKLLFDRSFLAFAPSRAPTCPQYLWLIYRGAQWAVKCARHAESSVAHQEPGDSSHVREVHRICNAGCHPHDQCFGCSGRATAKKSSIGQSSSADHGPNYGRRMVAEQRN